MAAAALLALAVHASANGAQTGDKPKPQRVKVTGEVIDSWCYVSGIMFAEGTAHHQCAVWCAVGGIPVGVNGDDGKVYIVLKSDETGDNVSVPRIIDIQTHKITADADLYVRDGVNYLVFDKVLEDGGVVNMTHETYGIQPFGE